jgi:ribosomal-protein-alanine N-acetyltransferase
VVLRPLRRRDANEWTALRTSNQAWLDRWEATAPLGSGITSTFGEYVRTLGRQARSGTSLPFVVEYRGEIAGQITVSSIMYGSLRSASIGYWIAQSVAGRGITPTAVALVTDHCFQVLGLHRMEVNIRPENGPSLRVVEKLGFRDEGVRERFLHIQGGWRDHRTFALTVEDVPDGLLPRWRRLRNGL